MAVGLMIFSVPLRDLSPTPAQGGYQRFDLPDDHALRWAVKVGDAILATSRRPLAAAADPDLTVEALWQDTGAAAEVLLFGPDGEVEAEVRRGWWFEIRADRPTGPKRGGG